MPSILRIFLTKKVASLPYIGSYASNGIIVGQGVHGGEHDLSATLCRSDLVGECADAVMHDEAGHDYGSGYCYHFECCLHVCVFNGRGR